MTQRRIAMAGFQHETNTFAPFKATLADFEMPDSWPALLLGEAVIDGTKGMNLPIAGAIAEADLIENVQIVPLLWASAEPSGRVTTDAFDRIMDEIEHRLTAAGPVDGIYLDLHGAMVTDAHLCGETAILKRLRDLVGPDKPIAISLDLHANMSADMVHLSDVITIFRTYPHLDMAETGARAVRELLHCLERPKRCVAFRQVPFLVPLNAQYTGAEPCQQLYEHVESAARAGESIDLALGFTAADVPDCGPAVVAYAATQTRANDLADALLAQVSAAQTAFDTRLYSAEDAIEMAQAADGTVILADVQDNAGAGGSSDTTGVLKALIAAGATNAVVGVVHDPDISVTAHAHGTGATFTAAMGGKSGVPGDSPLNANYRVLAVSDGRIAYTGEMYGGGVAEIGPSCLLQVDVEGCDIKVVVSSVRTQCLDQALFTHFGVAPADCKIVCVKSTVHFRADFEPISARVINVASPGWFVCDLDLVKYRQYRHAKSRGRDD